MLINNTSRANHGLPGIQQTLIATILLIASIPAHAQPLPTIYGYSLEFRLKDDGVGQYNELFDVLQARGLKFDLKISPLKRVARNFLDGPEDLCAFPTSKNAIKRSSPEIEALPLIFSDGVDQISLRVFTRPDSPKILSISELQNKKVAIWNGLDPKLFLQDTNAEVETTANELIRVKMLDAHRIDAILGFTPDVILAAQRLDLPLPHFDDSLALFKDEGASLVCKDSPQTRRLIASFNEILANLKQTGKLQEILGPYVEIVH